jgi:hypothetical protein
MCWQCVEVLNTTVEGTTTTTFKGAPTPAPYADYRSTNPPWLVSSMWPKLMPYGEYTIGVEYARCLDLT